MGDSIEIERTVVLRLFVDWSSESDILDIIRNSTVTISIDIETQAKQPD